MSQLGFNESVEVFFDEDNLTAGVNWLTEIDNALSQSDVCIVFIGEQGIGGWQNKEALKAVNKNVDSKGNYKIIPVILPYENRKLTKNFPWFLADYQWVEFSDVSDKYAFNTLLAGIRDNKHATINISGINPYKGLDYFEIKDAPFFFGRIFDLNWAFYKKLKLSSKNATHNFLAIVGDSGSGKSSFARAGILASLRAGKYENSDKWPLVITKPGDRPLLNLSTSLQKERIIDDSGSFDKNALDSKDQLRRTVEVYGSRIILLIDQFEETLTQCKDEQERKAYLQNLTEANKSGKLIILVTLRSDYYASFSKYAEFADILETNNYTLSGLDFSDKDDDWEKRIADIIEMPAKLAGVNVQPSLTHSIIQDLKGLQGTLPLLEMALSHIWKSKQHDAIIDLNDYGVVSGGRGMAGIVERHADKAYNTYTNEEKDSKKSTLLKNIFVRLVELTTGKDDVRKTVQKTQLEDELTGIFSIGEVNDALVYLSGEDARLISMRTDENKQVSIQVVHEVLIRNWSRLKGWIDERRDALLYYENLLRDIEEYNSNNKIREFLYSGKRLNKAKEWMHENADLVSKEIKIFINKPVQTQKKKKAQTAMGFLFIGLVSWLGYVIYDNYQFNNSAVVLDLKSRNIDLDSLHTLTISNQSDIKNLGKFKKLDSLILSGSGITSLSAVHLPETIKYLKLNDLENIHRFFELGYLRKLKSLELSNLYLPNLKGIENLHNLTSLRLMNIDDLNDLSAIKKLHNLRSLTFNNLSGLYFLSDIENLNSLISLTLTNNFSLQNLSGIEKLHNLTSFTYLNQNGSSRNLSAIGNLHALTSLSLQNANVENLSFIKNLHNLNSLEILYPWNLQTLSGIENLNKLTSLTLIRPDSLKNLSGIGKLNNLTSLTLIELPHDIKNLSEISDLHNLTSVSIDSFQYLSIFKNVHKFTSFTITDIPQQPKDLSILYQMNNLSSLWLESVGNLPDLEKLHKLTSLKLGYLNNLSGIDKLDNLTFLALYTIKDDVRNLSGIQNLKHLSILQLFDLDDKILNSLISSLPEGLKIIYIDKKFLSDNLKQKIKHRAPKCQILFND